jgi:hypothetical protein
LWSMEGPNRDALNSLQWLQSGLPIEYVVVAGEENSIAAAERGMKAMLNYLESNGQLVGTSKSGPFVRVYKLIKVRASQ